MRTGSACALVYLRYNEQITNHDYQRLNQVDSLTAGRELRGLVQTGLIEQQSARRWAYYTLKVSREVPGQVLAVSEEDRILAYAREKGSIEAPSASLSWGWGTSGLGIYSRSCRTREGCPPKGRARDGDIFRFEPGYS